MLRILPLVIHTLAASSISCALVNVRMVCGRDASPTVTISGSFKAMMDPGYTADMSGV